MRIHDLMRYGIEAVLLDDYKQIPDILADIQREQNVILSLSLEQLMNTGSAWETRHLNSSEIWSGNFIENTTKLLQVMHVESEVMLSALSWKNVKIMYLNLKDIL